MTQSSPSLPHPIEYTFPDYFKMQGHCYLAYADWNTGWLLKAKCDPLQADAKTLCRSLRTLFGTTSLTPRPTIPAAMGRDWALSIP